MTGRFGDMGCFSFYANKIITTGEGGMVVTDDDELAERLRLLRNLAFTQPRFCHEVAGYNFRMTGYQAAMGRVAAAAIETHRGRKAARRGDVHARARRRARLRRPSSSRGRGTSTGCTRSSSSLVSARRATAHEVSCRERDRDAHVLLPDELSSRSWRPARLSRHSLPGRRSPVDDGAVPAVGDQPVGRNDPSRRRFRIRRIERRR